MVGVLYCNTVLGNINLFIMVVVDYSVYIRAITAPDSYLCLC